MGELVPFNQDEIETINDTDSNIPACQFDEISIKNSQNVVLGQNLTVHGNVSIISGNSGYNKNNTLISVQDSNENETNNSEQIFIRSVTLMDKSNNKKGEVKREKVHLVVLLSIVICFIILCLLLLNYTENVNIVFDRVIHGSTHASKPNSNNETNEETDRDFNSSEIQQNTNFTCLDNVSLQNQNDNFLFQSTDNNIYACSHNKSLHTNHNVSLKTDIRFVVPKSLMFLCTFVRNFSCHDEFHKEKLKHINECYHDIYYHFMIGVNGKFYQGRSLHCNEDEKFNSINSDSTLIIGISYCYSESRISNVKGNGEFDAIENLFSTLKTFRVISSKITLHFPKYCENSFVIKRLKKYCKSFCEIVFYLENRPLEKEILLDPNGTYAKRKQLPLDVYDETIGSIYDVKYEGGYNEPDICIKEHSGVYVNQNNLPSFKRISVNCKTQSLSTYYEPNSVYDIMLLRHLIVEKEKLVLDLIYIQPESSMECDVNTEDARNLESDLSVCHGRNTYENRLFHRSFLIYISPVTSDILTIDMCNINSYLLNEFPFHLIFDYTLLDSGYEKYKHCQYLEY